MTPRTCLLVHDGTLSDLAHAWEDDRRTEGWQVLPSIAETDLDRLRKRLDGLRPDHTFLAGDNVPRPTVQANPDGHYPREVCADYSLVRAWNGAIGRVYFAGCDGDGRSSSELYRAYFEKRSRAAEILRNLPLVDAFTDCVYDMDLEAYGIMDRSLIPAGVATDYRQPYPKDADTSFRDWGKRGRLTAQAFSGGNQYASELFYVGGWQQWKAADPKIGIFGAFGSFLCQLEWKNSLLMYALTGSTTLAALYNHFCYLDWSKLFTGATVGDIARAYRGNGDVWNVAGDPTIAIPDDVASAAQLAPLVADLQRRVGLLESRAATIGPTSPTFGPLVVPSVVPAAIVRTAGEDWSDLADDGRKHSPVIPSAFPFPASTFDTYDVARGGFIEYRLAASGPCTVTLALCEPYHTLPGQRPMVVSANGEQVITNLDPATVAGGSFKAVAKSFSASPVGGVVVVRIAGMPGAADMNPCVGGIRVDPVA